MGVLGTGLYHRGLGIGRKGGIFSKKKKRAQQKNPFNFEFKSINPVETFAQILYFVFANRNTKLHSANQAIHKGDPL